MGTPGFIAEASLYQTSEHYHMGEVSLGSAGANELVPQAWTDCCSRWLMHPSLQRVSQWLGSWAIASMLEITSSILNADRRKRFAQHLHQSLPRACSCLAHRTLELAERFFYRVEVRRVGGQVDQLATPPFDQLPHPCRFVGGKIVHDHDLPGLQGRPQDTLYVSLEDFPVARALYGHRLAHPAKEGLRGQKGGVLAAVSWDLEAYALAFRRVTIKGRKRGM